MKTLIDRVLAADEAATKGPWKELHNVGNGDWRTSYRGLYPAYERDMSLITLYRSACPRLARALRLAIEALEVYSEENRGPKIVLAAIEKELGNDQ